MAVYERCRTNSLHADKGSTSHALWFNMPDNKQGTCQVGQIDKGGGASGVHGFLYLSWQKCLLMQC